MPYLVDASAYARLRHPTVKEAWDALSASDELIAHPVFRIEVLHSAQHREAYDELELALEDLPQIRPDTENDDDRR